MIYDVNKKMGVTPKYHYSCPFFLTDSKATAEYIQLQIDGIMQMVPTMGNPYYYEVI